MPKRKSTTNGTGDTSDSDSLVNVELHFFDPAEHDFHGLKSLLTQLFHTDAQSSRINVSALADLIIDDGTPGVTVKCGEDEASAEAEDPYAFVAVLDLAKRRDEDAVKGLVRWLRGRVRDERIAALLGQATDGNEAGRVGLVLSERLINMPADVAPGLWTQLLDSIRESQTSFTHFLVLSKTYTEVASQTMDLDDSEEEEQPRKKRRQKGATRDKDGEGEMMFFHPEDEVLMRRASAHAAFAYEKELEGPGDAGRAFSEAGIKPQGAVFLIEGGLLGDVVKEVARYIGGGAAASAEA